MRRLMMCAVIAVMGCTTEAEHDYNCGPGSTPDVCVRDHTLDGSCVYVSGDNYACNCETTTSGGVTVTRCDTCTPCSTCPAEDEVGSSSCVTRGQTYACVRSDEVCGAHRLLSRLGLRQRPEKDVQFDAACLRDGSKLGHLGLGRSRLPLIDSTRRYAYGRR